MSANLNIIGLTDLDRLTLHNEFKNAGQADAISFDERNADFGSAGNIDPITAVVVVSSLTLTVTAIWICLKKHTGLKIRRASDGEEVEISINSTTECKSDVL